MTTLKNTSLKLFFFFFLCLFPSSRFIHPILIRHRKLQHCSISDQLNLITLLVSIYLQSVSVHTPTATPTYRKAQNKSLPTEWNIFLAHLQGFNLFFRKASLSYQCHSSCRQVNYYIINNNREENESKGKHDLKIYKFVHVKSATLYVQPVTLPYGMKTKKNFRQLTLCNSGEKLRHTFVFDYIIYLSEGSQLTLILLNHPHEKNSVTHRLPMFAFARSGKQKHVCQCK